MHQNNISSLKDERVARLLVGLFINADYEEPIQIEYRYDSRTGFNIFTRIQNRDYYLSGNRYFDVMSELLDQLPASSKIIIHHRVFLHKEGKKEIVELEEHLYPYEIRNTATVMYQIKFSYQGKVYETHPSSEFGGSSGTRGGVLEELRSMIDGNFVLGVCYFCRYLVDVNMYGGTDYRHDQLYCFRDKQDALIEIEKKYPRLFGLEDLVNTGTANMSSLHGCASFSYQAKPRP